MPAHVAAIDTIGALLAMSRRGRDYL